MVEHLDLSLWDAAAFANTGDFQERIKETAVRNHFSVAYPALLREMDFITTKALRYLPAL